MDFFNSLTLDLKMLVIAIAGCAVLALLSGNQKSEKRYLVLLAVLAALGVYRFTTVGGDEQAQGTITRVGPPAVTVPSKHKPLESTFAR